MPDAGSSPAPLFFLENKMDITEIKQAFIILSALKVKEVVLPYDEYYKLQDMVNLHSDDGGSHNFQRKFDEFPRMCIYGIEVKYV